MDFAVGLCKIGLFLLQVHFLMLGGSFQIRSSNEDRKAVNMEIEPTQDFKSLQTEKTVSGLLSVQSVSPLRSGLRLHLSFAIPR